MAINLILLDEEDFRKLILGKSVRLDIESKNGMVTELALEFPPECIRTVFEISSKSKGGS